MAEPLKATFFAFRRREQRGVLWRASLLHGFNALALAIIGVGFPLLLATSPGIVGGLPPNATGWLVAVALILFVLLYQLNAASFEAACLRWLIRSERKSSVGLDRDTWRIYFGEWLWFAVYVVVWLFVLAISAVLAIPFRDSANASLWVPLIFFSLFGVGVLLITVRFGAANAVGLARQRFAPFDGWKASKGRFWGLLGSWLIATLIWTVTAIVMVIAVGLTLGLLARSVIPIDGAAGGAASLIGGISATRLVLTPFIAGINARAVLAAAEEGKIEGFQPNESVARVFE
jgi:hypothetical protein